MAVKVVFAALEEVVFFYSQHNVQISWRSALDARVTFGGHAQLVAVIDSGWNFELQRFLTNDASFTLACLARILDHLARAVTMRARSGDAEESLLEAHLSVAVARRTLCGT